MNVPAFAQELDIRGIVKDTQGLPVAGAGVFVDGTTIGASTSLDGEYSIQGVPSDAVLAVSCIGYKTLKVPVEGRSTIDIVLEEEAFALEETMVVAYGTAKKESFTGSASVVKGDDLRKRVVGNVTKSFEGSVAGVQVSSGGGQPGEGASVMVRGIGSVNAASTPLYVVDGIPYDGSLSAINPADIETMTVLKDASAGALYGARGANGVIVITTRRGKEDHVSISYKGTVGVASRALKRYDLVGMDDFVELTYEALRNSAQYGTGMDFEGASGYASANLGQTIGGLKNPEYYNPYKNYTWETLVDPVTGKVRQDASAAWNENWMDEISDNSAIRTEHVLSVSGGNQKISYLISMGYYKENGILQNTDFDRYTGRVNVDSQANDWFKIGMNANFTHTVSDYQDFSGSSVSNVWYTAQFMAPVYPVYQKDMDGNNVLDRNGNLMYEYGAEDDNGFANRPVAQGFNS
ncbi:MAG: SusC/RagA family TonB-linked outer membrane protein, partial [Bacteroidales bacterium]|nr:SusC/RagA family TonB-linked outer membrane protein [Bacteroidales bacterium]